MLISWHILYKWTNVFHYDLVHTDVTKLKITKPFQYTRWYMYMVSFFIILGLTGFAKSQQNTTTRERVYNYFNTLWERHAKSASQGGKWFIWFYLKWQKSGKVKFPQTHTGSPEMVARNETGYFDTCNSWVDPIHIRNSAIRQERWVRIILTFEISILFYKPRVSHNLD